jgi:methylase of polypeptide subunit release factors
MMGAGHVTAVDVMPAACALAEKNIERNGLKHKITVRCGNLFEPVAGQVFDMIIDDVSGVADRVARISPWFPSCIPTGGEDGTDLIIKVLDQARHHLRPGGWIYFPILSLSAGRKIVDSAQRFFAGTAECLASYSIPFCKEFYDAIEELEQLRQRGLIDFAKRGSRYTWTLEVWRAQLPLTARA